MSDPIFEPFENKVVREIKNPKGFVVIHSYVNDLTCGGLRIKKDVTKRELMDLARIMHLKQAFVGLPRGGARAGIVDNNFSEEEKTSAVVSFGEKISDLITDRKFLLGPDVGTTPLMIQKMYKNVGISIPKTSKTSKNSGLYTAIGVFTALEKSLQLKKLQLHECSVAIEGYGRVGKPLARMLAKKGAKIVAVSTIKGGIYNKKGIDVDKLSIENDVLKHPGKKIKKEDVVTLDVDILCPCATDSTINKKNMRKVKAKVICAGANNPVTLAADKYLFEKSVLYFPDFVTNCGGVLGNALEFVGLKEKHLLQVLRGEVWDRLNEFYAMSIKENIPSRLVAIRVVKTKFGRFKEKHSNKFVSIGLSLFRKGFIPKMFVRKYALKKIRRGIYG